MKKIKLLHLLLKKNINALADKSDYNLILKSMNVMKLKNIQRGSNTGVCKCIMLNRRFFEKTGFQCQRRT